MPPVDVVRQFQQPDSDFANVKVSQEQGASFEPTKSSAAIALRGKDFGGLGGFENIVNGRYSGIGRGGSVGDELVRTMRVSCSLVGHEMETIPIENDQIRTERV